MTDGQFKNFIINLLRAGSFKWKPRNAAKKRYKVPNGKFKNGNTKYGYQCHACKNTFMSKEIQMDHIEPVVPVNDGFTSFDDYIHRMFCPEDGFAALCKPCHDEKTKKEKEFRMMYRKADDPKEIKDLDTQYHKFLKKYRKK